jgi:hypothetical protein
MIIHDTFKKYLIESRSIFLKMVIMIFLEARFHRDDFFERNGDYIPI